MATIDKRIGADGTTTYRVRVRKLGHPTRTKTFTRKTDAQAWARQLEAKIDKGQTILDQAAARRTLSDAIDRYLKDTLPHKARNKNAANVKRILQWWRDELGAYTLPSLTPAVITEARDTLRRTRYKRKGKGGTSLDKERSPGTVNRYLVSLSAVLTTATDEWMWLETSPMAKVKKLGEPRGPGTVPVRR